MEVDHNVSQYTDTDGDSEDELALIEAAAAHFGAGSNGGKRSGTRRSNNYQERQQQHQQQPEQQQQHPTSTYESMPAHFTNPMQPAYKGTSMLRQSTRRYSRRASRRLSRRSAASSSSNTTVLRRNGNGPCTSPAVVQEGECTEEPTFFQMCTDAHGSTDDTTDPGTTSGGSIANMKHHNNRFAFQTTNDVPLAVNIGTTIPINETDQRMTNINDAVDQDSSLDEDDEIAQFSEMLPHEYQRLSNMNLQHQQRPSLPGQNYLRGSALSIDSSLMPGNMSGTISRKRRSHQNVADAAAQAAAFFRDLSDSEDGISSNQDEDSSACPTFCSKLSNGTRKTSVTQQSSATRRSSGASTAGFSRLSLRNNSYGLEERPRKRRSSSSSISRCDDSIHRLSFPTRQSYTSNVPMERSSNNKAYNAASAAVAADEAAQRLSEVSESNIHVHSHTRNDGNAQSGQNKPTMRKFKRRAAFVVSSIETEAAAALAERTQLLQKDRYEKVRLKRPQARRSMSYSSGIKMTSSIIASALPEDAETIMENPEIKTDFMKLTRSRMERRVLSLPDQNAVVRLSQTSINDDVDFTGDASHQSSALSANLEASAAALKKSFKDGRYQSYSSFQPMSNPLAHSLRGNQNQYDEHYPISMKPSHAIPAQQLPLPNNFQIPPQSAVGVPLQYPTNYLDQNHNTPNFYVPSQQPLNPPTSTILEQRPVNQNPTVSILGSSYQVAAEVFNTNAIAAQSLAKTAEAAIAMLQKAQVNTSKSQIISESRSIEFNNDDFDLENFDGKVEKIKSISPDTPEEVEASDKIHEAAEKDDIEAIKSIWNICKETSRMTLNESESGNVALHTGKCSFLWELYGETITLFSSSLIPSTFLATKNGSFKAVDFLLATDADCALIRNGDGNSALHLAVEDGNLTLSAAICAISPDSAKVQVCKLFASIPTLQLKVFSQTFFIFNTVRRRIFTPSYRSFYWGSTP